MTGWRHLVLARAQIIELRAAVDAWASWLFTFDPEVRPSCAGRGCFGCCRNAVLLPGEAELLVEHLTEVQIERVVLAPSAGWCPLLDLKTGACTVYEERPLICRMVFASTPASHCLLADREVTLLFPTPGCASPVADCFERLGLVKPADQLAFMQERKEPLSDAIRAVVRRASRAGPARQ